MGPRLNQNLVFLTLFICALLVALFIGEKMFPMDGQFFMVIAGAFGSVMTLFVQAVRSVFHIPDTPGPPPPGTTSQVTSTTQTTIQHDPNVPAATPHKESSL